MRVEKIETPRAAAPAPHGLLTILHAIRKQIVDEAPQELAFCEFDCREPQCSRVDRVTCPVRLRYAAAMLPPRGTPRRS